MMLVRSINCYFRYKFAVLYSNFYYILLLKSDETTGKLDYIIDNFYSIKLLK